MKPFLKSQGGNVILIVLVLLFGFGVYRGLPGQVGIHFALDGSVNGYASRAFLVLFMPLVNFAVLILFFLRRQYVGAQRPMVRAGAVLTKFLCLLQFWLVMMNLHHNWCPLSRALPFAMGFLLILLGTSFRGLAPNPFLGVRTSWSLSSRVNWDATHDFARKLFHVFGYLCVVCSILLPSIPIAMVLVFIAAVVPVYYSYRFYTKYEL
jgi:uncharacterized membrane protein